MLTEHKNLLDWLAWGCAGIAAVSLSQAALAVTLVAGLVSITLGAIRVYDRLTYGTWDGPRHED